MDYAVSTYTNPEDPVLSQGFEIVPVRETTDHAYLVDLAYDLLRDRMIGDNSALNLTLGYLRGRTDPLYKALAAAPTPDTEFETWSLRGSAGLLSFQLEHLRSEDNLDSVASILKTKTKDTRFNLTYPFASAMDAGPDEIWWPQDVSYSLQRTHQYGANLPIGFDDPASQIPDQVDYIHAFNLTWAGEHWDFGYGLAFADQDNQQAGRANAGFRNLGHTFNLGLRPLDTLSLRFGYGHVKATDFEISLDRFNKGYTFDFDWTFAPDWILTGNYGYTNDDDNQDIEESDQISAQTQVSWRFRLPNPGEGSPLPGQVFLRHVYLDNISSNREFEIDTRGGNWAIHSGLSLSLY